MNQSVSRKNSLSASSEASTATLSVAALRQNAQRVLQGCEQSLQQLLGQSQASTYSVSDLFVFVSQQYCLRQQDMRQLGRMLAQATDLVEQETQDKSALITQLQRDRDQLKLEVESLRQAAEEYRHEIIDLREKLQQAELSIMEVQDQRQTLSELYKQTLERRTSLIESPHQLKQASDTEDKMLEVTLLMAEVQQLKTDLLHKDGIISQKQFVKSELYEKLKETRIRAKEIEHENLTLKDTVAHLQNRIDELSEELRDLQQRLEKQIADTERFDGLMETKETEPWEDDGINQSQSPPLFSTHEHHPQIEKRVSLTVDLQQTVHDEDRSKDVMTSTDQQQLLTGKQKRVEHLSKMFSSNFLNNFLDLVTTYSVTNRLHRRRIGLFRMI